MKVAIAGYGVEGKASYQYWRDLGHEVTIVDEKQLAASGLPEGVDTRLGEGVFGRLDEFDLIVRTASLNPARLSAEKDKIWSATNEFFSKCPADIVGVTGTKGKGTTSSLIASILGAAGKKIHLVGNIGTAALQELPSIESDDIVVFELSSFQLWDLQKSPKVAVLLMIEPDHLNVHDDMQDYVAAKSNIRAYQVEGDLCIYHPTNRLSAEAAHVSQSGTLERYAIPDDGGVYEKAGYFCQGEQTICSTDALQLLGRHNLENACAAISAARYYDVSNDAVEKGLREFTGLPHRLEYVGEVDGVTYYNDSFSSAPAATIAAVRSFEQPEILILGGTDKGADFSHLLTELSNSANLKKVLLIGEVRHQLQEMFDEAHLMEKVRVLDVKTMGEVLSAARQEAESGDVVLLSPACASFDMFRDFYDRGDQFRTAVKML